MIRKHFEDSVSDCLGFPFSPTQKQAMECFAGFFLKDREEGLFVLKGYAGTGKTSFVAAVVNALMKMDYKVVLLAPTGRAAKVFSAYAGQPAFTIHKKIYRQKTTKEGEGNFILGFNPGANTLFFVDEASMISNATEENGFGSGHLLDDLVEYVYNGRNNRLVLIGDEAQLPPVGLEMSPALEPRTLRTLYNLEVYEAHLTDVMRQAETSGILHNATSVRSLIGTGSTGLKLRAASFPDVYKIGGGELLEELEACYGKFGLDETMVVCRSNKRANRYNEGIRRTVLYREDDFCSGDKVMIVKNNYFWGKEYEHLDFIANGEIATILRVGKRMELYGLHFVRAEMALAGYEGEIQAWVMLDTLFSDYPALSYEESKAFYWKVEADYVGIRSRKKRFEKVRENEYYNALQVKFAYAVTCHKAQGGQWDAVFIDQGWLPEDILHDEYWRWLYTAVTRARKRVYFVNFKDVFFDGE